MKTLIVGKTRAGTTLCLGGWVLDSNHSVRLLDHYGAYHPFNTDYEIGQIWDMEFAPAKEIIPPHTEDVLIKRKELIGTQADLKQCLLERVPVWRGNPRQLFGGLLCFNKEGHKGSGYICQEKGLPEISTGFWLADRDLTRADSFSRVRYQYPHGCSIPYVGTAAPAHELPAGTLLRVSLARWHRHEDTPDDPERCYLQLSGWF